jgi:hypothetical protein
MPIETPKILNDEENRRKTIQSLLNVCWKHDPETMQAMIDDCKRIRGRLTDPRAISKEKTLSYFMEIPQKVFYMMVAVFGKSWMDDPKTSKIFFSEASCFRINEKSIPAYKVDRTGEYV